MEKRIKEIIESFLKDKDRERLNYLDQALFNLLLEKEMYILKQGKDDFSGKIDHLLDSYFNYRDYLCQRLHEQGMSKQEAGKLVYGAPSRLILLLTHNCQLRCKYCKVSKFSAFMKEDIAIKAVDFLFTSNSQEIQIQFFGGEPLLHFDLLKRVVLYAEKVNKRAKRELMFILTTNGIELTKTKVNFLKRHRFLVEFSIDGQIENQMRIRKSRSGASYYKKMMNNFEYLRSTGIPYYSISVFMPENVSCMFDSFVDLSKRGFRKLQLNYSLGIFWQKSSIKELFRQTKKIVDFTKENDVEFINFSSVRREPVVVNAELTVDSDGEIYLESGICLEEDFLTMKRRFLVASVNGAKDINKYYSSQFQNLYRLAKAYGEIKPKFRKIILNNVMLGREYSSFLNKLRRANKVFIKQRELTCDSYLSSNKD